MPSCTWILVGDEKLGMYVVYMDSMYDQDFIDGVVLKSLLFDRIQLPDQNAGQVILINIWRQRVAKANQMEMLIDEVLKGNTAFSLTAWQRPRVVSSKSAGLGYQSGNRVSVRGSRKALRNLSG